MGLPDPVPGVEVATAGERRTSPLAAAAVAFSALCAASAAMAGIGTRLALWNFRTGLAILKLSAEGALAALFLSLAALWAGRRGRPLLATALPVLGLLLAAPVIALPWNMARHARQLPAIHDISTDTGDPPAFVAVLPLRAGAANPSAYGGPEVAAAQRSAYPDLRPAILADPPEKAFWRADAAARRLGWRIVSVSEKDGRIEATDTTFWFGFKDDVVIRVRPEGAGSRVDVRSVSRVGRGDVGKNAERIREFLALL